MGFCTFRPLWSGFLCCILLKCCTALTSWSNPQNICLWRAAHIYYQAQIVWCVSTDGSKIAFKYLRFAQSHSRPRCLNTAYVTTTSSRGARSSTRWSVVVAWTTFYPLIVIKQLTDNHTLLMFLNGHKITWTPLWLCFSSCGVECLVFCTLGF